MNMDWHDLIQRYISGTITEAETEALEQQLKTDAALRDWYLDAVNLDSALEVSAEAAELALSLPVPPSQRVLAPASSHPSRWYSWRPVTAAAAGIVLGMFCTSVVFGYVAQRADAVKKMPLAVFNPGLEDEKQTLEDGLPDRIGQWGMDAASVVSAEGHVKPLQGQRMMRLEPIPREKDVKNHTSRAYQLLDLRSLPIHELNGDAEVQVSASFYSTTSDVSSRYMIRALALDEAPEQAMMDFWSKSESDGVVSESQRFDTKPGDRGWHTFSLKLRLPPESKTLVLILGAVPPEEPSIQPSVHYLDEVQVSLLTPESTLP